jgi:hypothetical protein
MTMAEEKDLLHQVQNYRKIVLLYEALDEEIDKLIMTHHGSTEKMSETDIARYRDLARQRDDLLNEMRAIENQLHIDDTEP